MAIKSSNIQVCVTLPRELIEKIDILAKEDDRTRSKMIAKMVKEHYQQNYNHSDNKEE